MVTRGTGWRRGLSMRCLWRRSASTRAVRLVLGALAVVAGGLGAERDALACSYGVPSQPGTVQCESAPSPTGIHTSVGDARFGVTNIDVERPAPAPDTGAFECSPLQVLGLQFQWGDDVAWPSDIGLLVTLDEGDFPWIEPRLSETPHGLGWVMRADDAGQVQFFGFDSPYDPLDLTLAVRAIDCAGVLSDPITLRIRDPGSPLPEGDGAGDPEADSAAGDGGCSLRAAPGAGEHATTALLMGLCGALMAARRVRHARRSARR